MITLETPWRRIGAVPADTWRAEFQAKGSPMLADAAACCEAAGPHGALALVQAWVESQYATTGRLAAHRNPLGLRPSPDHTWRTTDLPGAGTFIAFDTWAPAFTEWRRRLFDEAATYKQGAYAKAGPTLLNLVEVYCPKGPPGTPEASNDPPKYAASLARELNRLHAPILEEISMPEIVFGRVPHPPFVELICQKPAANNAGFTLVPSRDPVGTCEHRTEGRASIEWYHQFFSTGGERAWDALVDYVVGSDGRIAMLNHPRGTRMPWANGKTDGLEGDGPAFVRTLGVGAVNARLVSIEIVGMPRDPFEGAQFESVAQLMAHWHDQAGVPWNRFPFNPKVGCVTDLQHYEFTGKGGNSPEECPGSAVRSKTNPLQNRVRAIMRQFQEGGGGTSEPPIEPVDNPANTTWPNGYTTEGLTQRFGRLERELGDGTIKTYTFDPTGILSNAWVERGANENLTMDKLPRPLKWWTLEVPGADTRDIVVFERNWTLEQRAGRSGWAWTA